MQKNLINLSALTLIIAGLTACGGGSSGGSKKSSTPAISSVAMISSVAASSVAASSITPASSSSVSSIDPDPLVENTTPLVTIGGVDVAEIVNCGSGITLPASTSSFSMFADYDVTTQNLAPANLTGWNHINSTATWANVSKVPSTYNFPSTTVTDAGCNNVDTFKMILVKKIANWDQQHGNGFERSNMFSEGITFGKVKSITVDLKINSTNTIIPTVDALKAKYVPAYVTADKIDSLENGKVYLDITLYQKNLSSEADFRAKINFEIDQATMSDKWLRVTIPASALYYYSENNYTRTDSTADALASISIKGAIVVAETKRGNTLRNDIQGAWVGTTPETFKEVDVSFKKIELNLE
ncbi:MAG: hypothetical protein V4732_11985 [Pseudomonadota bacterium]